MTMRGSTGHHAAAPRERRPLRPQTSAIYPRETTGRHTTARWIAVWITQIVFYGLPWLQLNGRQAVLFDLPARHFYLFGAVFWPQDFIYLAGMLVICACLLFLSSALGGRVWCSYGCPHGVYSEIFLWIERKIEGGRSARMRLDNAPWSSPKLAKKVGKHAAWLLVSAWTGITLVAYFTPMRVLLSEIGNFTPGPWESFWMLAYGGLAYANAGWMRTQFCRQICAWARFQSVMFDRDTLVVAYDAYRGEPRGLRGRHYDPETMKQGDCIDCTICVQACPAGIDIRNGFQYDCLDCGACIDACNAVMDKIGAPRGLIRYMSERRKEAA